MTVLRLPENTVGRDFIVGDIHGCTELFWRLYNEIGFDPGRDRMFSVGDLIDRGPDSQGALALLQQHWFYAVRGNHEQLMLDALVTMGQREIDLWFGNGGEWANVLPPDVLDGYAMAAAKLPIVISVGSGDSRFNVVHAEFAVLGDLEIDRGMLGHEQAIDALWGRRIVRGRVPNRVERISTTYCGHTPVDEIRFEDGHVFIDTGACYPGLFNTGRLTVVQHQPGAPLRHWCSA